MASFSQDKKWMEAKKVCGHLNWLEVIAYYREIQGTNVFVYSVRNGERRLIVDVFDDDTVILLNKNRELVKDSYERVLSSRKSFKYSEHYENQEYSLGHRTYTVPTEN
jgi:hypothetical protein